MYALEYRLSGYQQRITQVKAKIYYNSIYHLMDDSERDSIFYIEGDTPDDRDTVKMRMDMPGWSDTYGFYLEGNVTPDAKNKLYIRIDDYLNFSRANMTMHMENSGHMDEPPMYAETWPDMYRNVGGIFIRNTTYLNRTFNFSIDARMDFSTTRVISETGYQQFEIFGYDIDRDYNEMPKSINLKFNLKSNSIISLNSGVGYSERLPTNSEQFGFFLYNALDGYDYLGNPDIELEKSTNLWANIHFAWPKIKVSLRNRISKVNDYILGQIDPAIQQMNFYASGLKRYDNIPFAIVYGSSLQLQWDPHKVFTVYNLTRYTYARTYAGDPIPMIPPLRNLTICKIRHQMISFQAESELSTSQNRIDKNFGETTTPGFAIFNMRVSCDFMISEIALEISGGVENIFDRAYSEHLDWGNYYRPGRNIFLHLGVKI